MERINPRAFYRDTCASRLVTLVDYFPLAAISRRKDLDSNYDRIEKESKKISFYSFESRQSFHCSKR